VWCVVDDQYRDLLSRAGLDAFADFMACRGGDVIKRLPTKTISRIEAPSPTGVRRFYLKRHTGRVGMGERVRAWCSGFSPSWGRKEWEVIHAFRRAGIPTVTPVAAGERVCGGRRESFVMTEELAGFRSLESFVPSRWTPPLDRAGLPEKRAMVRRVAELTRRMHDAGFNHRDWYLCHIFARVDADGTWDLRVLDLQRVDQRRWLRRRWIIKDLAALNYSAPPGVITAGDRARFLNAYLNDGRALREHRALIRAIIRKTARIRRHDARLKRNRQATHTTAPSAAT
jgi:heptose I phosphotransferase